MEYLGLTIGAMLPTLCIVFVIIALGLLIGRIEIKGISLGTAGVLLVAILFGVLFSKVDSFTIGETTVTLWGSSAEKTVDTISKLGTAMFVTAVGLIAGPKFFRSFNKSMIAYLVMGVAIIACGVLITIGLAAIDPNMDISMATGLLSGSLTSTPAFSAAKEAAEAAEKANGLLAGTLVSQVTAGYGIGYLYGVLGVVLFVQIMPKVLKVDIAKERETFVAANTIQLQEDTKKRWVIDEFGFFAFFATVAIGMLIGGIKIPISSTSYFNFGSSGGTLIAGLIVGHFGHFGKVDMKVSKQTLKFFRELGLILFLVGAGIPGGVKFIAAFDWVYIVYGIIMATVPMVLGFVLGKYVFKLSIFNNLGSITGGMTSTPALGALISTAGTDDVSSAYAATYPLALVCIVVASNLMILIGA